MIGAARIETAVATAAGSSFTAMAEYRPKSWIKFIIVEGHATISLKHHPGETRALRAGQMIMVRPGATKLPEPQDVDLSELIKTSLKARLQSRDAFSVLNILPVEINAVLMIETKSRQKWIALSALAHFGWHDSLGRCPRFATANPSCGGLVLNAAPLGLNRYPRP